MMIHRFILVLAVGLSGTFSFADEAHFPKTLPGTKPLTINQPLDEVMVSGINKFAERELASSIDRRAKKWNRNYQNIPAYNKSVSANRARLAEYLGVVDPRVKEPRFEVVRSLSGTSVVGRSEADGYEIHLVRWPVLDGLTAEGLMILPKGPVKANLIALPDADWSPEQFCGLDQSDNSVPRRMIQRLARSGCRIVIPTLINRKSTHSGNPLVGYTNQPHREFVYRMAFEMGRQVIGYEVQKVLAAVDAYALLNGKSKQRVLTGVVGVGEGGMLALYAAALDPRISATLVSGYFQPREQMWKEPIYRNVWAQLTEFGDAELASLVAPRTLLIEACAVPEIAGPPKAKAGQRGGAAPGAIAIASVEAVRHEFEKARSHFKRLDASGAYTLHISGKSGRGPAGSDSAMSKFLGPAGKATGNGEATSALKAEPIDPPYRYETRHKRQFDEMVRFTQTLLRKSAKVRDRLWSSAKRGSVAEWTKTSAPLREHVYNEMIGRLPAPTVPPNVRTRKILDEPKFVGYEVVIDVYRDVIASGILLLPKNLKEGEKRPVVVCQHGLEGVPMDTITTSGNGHRYYKAFAAKLAERGFITYAPQNPYRGRDKFRVIQRKSNPLKRSLFSYIIPQHQRTLDWLATLPNVDAKRIGFYGLSYGGKTAVRVPPMLVPGKDKVGYCLSICSADFNEWVKKNTTNEDRYSYIFTGEYEIFEWNMGHVANYAELSNLMAPRPFMVERGHDDGVAPDEWVAWEYAKIRRHYVKLGLADKTEIEFFNGPHTINGKGTFDFLHKHLQWKK